MGSVRIFGEIGRCQHPLFELLTNPIQMGQKAVVLGQAMQAILGDLGGKDNGIMTRLLPQARVNATE